MLPDDTDGLLHLFCLRADEQRSAEILDRIPAGRWGLPRAGVRLGAWGMLIELVLSLVCVGWIWARVLSWTISLAG